MGYEDTGERLPTAHEFKEIPLIKRLTQASKRCTVSCQSICYSRDFG